MVDDMLRLNITLWEYVGINQNCSDDENDGDIFESSKANIFKVKNLKGIESYL